VAAEVSKDEGVISVLFYLRRNTVGISGLQFDVVEEGCKPTGITRSSEFAEKSRPAQT